MAGAGKLGAGANPVAVYRSDPARPLGPLRSIFFRESRIAGVVAAAAIEQRTSHLNSAWRLVSVVFMKTKKLNPHARALGRLGGKARTENLSPEERTRIARKAGLARSRKLNAIERKRVAALGGKASKGKPKAKHKEKT